MFSKEDCSVIVHIYPGLFLGISELGATSWRSAIKETQMTNNTSKSVCSPLSILLMRRLKRVGLHAIQTFLQQ